MSNPPIPLLLLSALWLLIGHSTGWPPWWRWVIGLPFATLTLMVYWRTLPFGSLFPLWYIMVISAGICSGIYFFRPRLSMTLALISAALWAWRAVTGNVCAGPWWLAIASGCIIGWLAVPAPQPTTVIKAPLRQCDIVVAVGICIIALLLLAEMQDYRHDDEIRPAPRTYFYLWSIPCIQCATVVCFISGFSQYSGQHLFQALTRGVIGARSGFCALGCLGCFTMVFDISVVGIDAASMPQWIYLLFAWAIASLCIIVAEWWQASCDEIATVAKSSWVNVVAFAIMMLVLGQICSVANWGLLPTVLGIGIVTLSFVGRSKASLPWAARAAGHASMGYGLSTLIELTCNPAGFSDTMLFSRFIVPTIWCMSISRGFALLARRSPSDDLPLPTPIIA